MLELLAGLFVALGALALVLEPLALGLKGGNPAGRAPSAEEDLLDPEESDSPKIRALLALREIEFDRATGKLSDEDYVRLKVRYEREAIEAIREEERGPGPGTRDPGSSNLASEPPLPGAESKGPRPVPEARSSETGGGSAPPDSRFPIPGFFPAVRSAAPALKPRPFSVLPAAAC